MIIRETRVQKSIFQICRKDSKFVEDNNFKVTGIFRVLKKLYICVT